MMEQIVNKASMLPPPPPGKSRSRSSTEDWEAQRPTIERLYSTEDKTLQEVRKIMSENGFHATQKQYQTHIERWGLEKKVKDKEMRAIIRMKRKRKEVDGKESEFLVRKRPVPQKKIRRWIQRTETLPAHAPASQSSPSASTPSDIFCYTPLAAGPATPDSMSNTQSVARFPVSPTSQAHNLPLGTHETTPAYPSSIPVPNPPGHLGPFREAPYDHAILPIFSAPLAWSPSVGTNLTPALRPFGYTTLPEWARDNWQVNFDGAGTPENMFNFTPEDQGNGPGLGFNPALIGMNTPSIQPSNGDSEFLFGETQNESTINPVEGEQVIPESASEIGVEIVASNDLAMSWTPEEESAIQLLRENGFDLLAKNIDEGKCLTWAAEEGHEAVLQLLLKDGADINARDARGRTALHQAALHGKDEILCLLLNERANIESQDDNGLTALSGAAFLAQEKAVKLLLEYGADVHTPDNSGWTALHSVTLFGSEAIARLLIEKGADVNALDNEEKPPLHEAARHGYEELVQLLLTNGSEVNAKSNTKFTALHEAAFNGYRNTVELLIENGAGVNAEDEEGRSALFYAAFARERAAVKILITKQADIKAKDQNGWTALHAAVCLGHKEVMELYEKQLKDAADDEEAMARVHWTIEHGHEAVVRLVLEWDGSELNSKTNEGWTMLALAARMGLESTVRLALDNGADIHINDNSGMTALHWAASGGYGKVVELLLEGGAYIESREEDYDRTALHIAAERGHKDVVERLLEKGVDIGASGGVYGNALQAAIAKGHEDVVRVLLEHGSDVHAKGGFFGTPLQAAASKGNEAVVRLLLEKGSEVSAEGGHYGNALKAAENKGHEVVAKLLREKGAGALG